MSGSLDIELTRRCNLRCDYCFVGWSRDWHSDMPLEVALAVVGEGAGLFPRLHLTGGEPFSYRGVFDVIEAGLDAGYGEILINTNGTMLSRDAADRLASYGSRLAISVSLDGPEAIHDSARGPGRFREACAGAKELLARKVRTSVMTVVTPVVLEELAPFVRRTWESLAGLSGFTLFPVGVGPSGSQKPGAELRSLTPDEIRELALNVALLYRTGIPIGIGAYPIVNPLLISLGYPASELYQCTAGRGRVCVHADLSVSPCHPVKEAVYGAYRRGLIREIGLGGSGGAHARLSARDFDGCRSCEHQEVCGHCRAFVAASGARLFENDGICRDILSDISEIPPERGRGRRVTLPVLD